jgi:hypothetical protein
VYQLPISAQIFRAHNLLIAAGREWTSVLLLGILGINASLRWRHKRTVTIMADKSLIKI